MISFRTVFLFSFSAILFFSLPVHVTQARKYMTREQLNQQAIEDAKNIHDRLQSGQEEQAPPPDYQKYSRYFDFKNVFFEVATPEQLEYLSYTDDSAWAISKRDRHQKRMNQAAFDYLVMPVQDVSTGNDLTSRKLPADLIGARITLQTGKTVMPTDILLEYLGRRALTYPEHSFEGLFLNKEPRIIHLLLKRIKTAPLKPHNDVKRQKFFVPANKKQLAVVVSYRGNVERFKFYDIEPISPQRPLDIQIIEKIEDIVSFAVNEKPSAEGGFKVSGHQRRWVLTDNIQTNIEAINDALDVAMWLQLLAAVTPGIQSFEKKRLYERSIASLTGADQNSEFYRILMARALHHLHRRPLALKYLKNSGSPGLDALKAYINGNYYQLETQIDQIKNPMLYVLSYLELVEIARAYDKPLPELSAKIINNGWRHIIQHAVDDKDLWASIDVQNLFGAMNELFPEFKDMVAQEVASELKYGNQNRAQAWQNILSNLITRISKETAEPDIPVYGTQVNTSDIWFLFQGLLMDIPLKPFFRMVYMQGAYNRAVRYGETLEPLFNGILAFDSPYSEALHFYAVKSPSSSRNFYLKKSLDITCRIRNTVYPYEKEYRRSEKIFRKNSNLVKNRNCQMKSRSYIRFYPSSENKLPYTANNFRLMETAYSNKEIDDAELNRQLAIRFEGSPSKIIFIAQRYRSKEGSLEKAIQYLEKQLKKDRQAWGVYNLLAKIHIENKSYEKARQVYHSFPDFTENPGGKRVRTSNLAYAAARRFDKAGRYDQAAEFYRLCSSFNTGSAREMASRYRLAIMDHNFYEAARQAYFNWQRYNKVWDMGNYLSMLSLLGKSTEIGPLFSRSLNQYDNSSNTGCLWNAIFVHHRVARIPFKQIETEIETMLPNSPSVSMKDLQRKYLFSQAYIDRKLHEDHIAAIHQYNTSKTGKTTRKTYRIGEIFKDLSATDISGREKRAEKITGLDLRDEYAHTFAAILLFQKQEYELASELFLFCDDNFKLLRNYSYSGFILPYAIMCFLEHPRSTPEMFDQVKKEIAPEGKIKKSFQWSLVMAAIHAHEGDHTTAFKYLDNAGDRKETAYAASQSPSPSYQLVSTAEWMYFHTGEKRYLTFALKWANRCRENEPQVAWAHAFHALYATSQESRIQSAGFASYLDPDSFWFSRVPADIQTAGIAWWKNNKPFIEQPDKKESSMSF